MNGQATKDKLAPLLANVEGLRLAYLFGSQAEGQAGPISDYDFGVLVDRSMDAAQLQARLAHTLARALGTGRIDVVILNQAPIELAYAIIAQGTLLFELDVATRVEYEAKVLSMYFDWIAFLRAAREETLPGDSGVHQVQCYEAALARTRRTLSQIAAAQGNSQAEGVAFGRE